MKRTFGNQYASVRFNFDGISDQGKSTGDLEGTQKRRKWKHEGHHVNKVVFHKTNFFQLTLHNHHSAIVMSSVQFKIDEQRKSYTFEFQITAAKKVQQIDRSLWKNRYSIVANEVGVHRSNIERWHKKYMRGGYRNIKCSHANKTFRSKGAERPIKYPEIEEYLLKFWNSLHKDEYPLASILLQLEALDYDPLFLGGVQHKKKSKIDGHAGAIISCQGTILSSELLRPLKIFHSTKTPFLLKVVTFLLTHHSMVRNFVCKECDKTIKIFSKS